MLTNKQIDDLEKNEFGPPKDVILVVLRELKEQRKLVIAALRCTGEDGHDGFGNLNREAEDYLDKITTKDPSWRTQYGSFNEQKAREE